MEYALNSSNLRGKYKNPKKQNKKIYWQWFQSINTYLSELNIRLARYVGGGGGGGDYV